MFPDRGAWGLVVHTPYDAKALTDLGVQWVRINLRWKDIETRSRGQYDWAEADRLVNFYLDHGFGVMCILSAERFNPLYKDDQANKDVVIEAIATWMGAAAQRYRGRDILWEIGNEPEVFPMGDYWSDPLTYASLASQASALIKRADPQAKVAALSVAWMDRGYVTKALGAGILEQGYIDVISFHGYHRHNLLPESGLSEDVTWLRDMVQRASKPGHSPIVVDSERGYAIVPDLASKSWSSWRNKVYTESEQAAYLARHYLEEIALGLEISVWYKDMSGEENYSLYYGRASDPRGLRPMGHVYRNLAMLLSDNPMKMVNRDFPVTLIDLPDKHSDPNGKVRVKTYLRSYLREGQKSRQLIVAMWHPVEAFEGRILETRKRVGDAYEEIWRPVTEDDEVDLPVQVRVDELAYSKVRSAFVYDLTAKQTNEARSELTIQPQDDAIVTPPLTAGPMPTVIVLELAESP